MAKCASSGSDPIPALVARRDLAEAQLESRARAIKVSWSVFYVACVTVLVFGVRLQIELGRETTPWRGPCGASAFVTVRDTRRILAEHRGHYGEERCPFGFYFFAQRTAYDGHFPTSGSRWSEIWVCPYGGDKRLLKPGSPAPNGTCPRYPLWKSRVASGRVHREGTVWGVGFLVCAVLFGISGGLEEDYLKLRRDRDRQQEALDRAIRKKTRDAVVILDCPGVQETAA
jgi:hypothetical protein